MDLDDLDAPRFSPMNGHATDTITVVLATDRRPVLSAWAPRLRDAPGIELHAGLAPGPEPLGRGLAQPQPLPAVLLLDKDWLDRLDAASLLMMQTCWERTRVLMLADTFGKGLVVDVVRHRFHGFLLTSCPPEVSLKAIRAVSRGELWLSRAALANLLAGLLPAPRPVVDAARLPLAAGSEHPLTRREQQIVELLRRGCSNKEIAHELGVMEDTVKKHLQAVFGKLGVHRRALVALRQS
jgi:DNA-binding NarL/FixJ family response regulator